MVLPGACYGMGGETQYTALRGGSCILELPARTGGCWDPETQIQTAVGMHAGANREILDFLRTGVLEWRPLGPCTRVRYVAPGGPPPTDWVGLNYYSRVVMDWRCQARSLKTLLLLLLLHLPHPGSLGMWLSPMCTAWGAWAAATRALLCTGAARGNPLLHLRHPGGHELWRCLQS